MKKNILIVVIILAITGYIAGVLTTKKLAEEQLPRMITDFTDYHDIAVQVEWLEQGLRSGKLRISGENNVDDSMSVTFSEEIDLTYGFLSARWRGQGFSQITSILADEPLPPYTYTSSGKVSRGGVFVDYEADVFSGTIDTMTFEIGAAEMQIALVGNKIVADWQAAYATIGMPGVDSMSMRDVKVHWGTQIRQGIVEVLDMRVAIGSMSFTDETEHWESDGINYTVFMDLTRDMATIYGTSAMDLPFLAGSNELALDWRLRGVVSSDVVKLQQHLANGTLYDLDFEDLQSLELQSEEPELVLERFDGASDQFGTLKMSGSVVFLADHWSEALTALDNDEPVQFDWAMQGLRIDITVAEAPPMMQMLLLTLPEDAQAMPLRFTLKDGLMEVNGFPLQ